MSSKDPGRSTPSGATAGRVGTGEGEALRLSGAGSVEPFRAAWKKARWAARAASIRAGGCSSGAARLTTPDGSLMSAMASRTRAAGSNMVKAASAVNRAASAPLQPLQQGLCVGGGEGARMLGEDAPV